MSLKSYGEWLQKNLALWSEDEIHQFLMEKRAAGYIEEPDEDMLKESTAIASHNSFSTPDGQALSGQFADRS